MIGIRKSLDYVFTQRELKILDDVMPETKRTEEDEKELGPEVGNVLLTCQPSDKLWILKLFSCLMFNICSLIQSTKNGLHLNNLFSKEFMKVRAF